MFTPFPVKVPSAYFLTDTFLMLDDLLKGKLFRAHPRHIQAAQEGQRAKKCIGALRYLWRSSQDNADNPEVFEMKQLLEVSPLQMVRRTGPQFSDAPSEPSDIPSPAALEDADEDEEGDDVASGVEVECEGFESEGDEHSGDGGNDDPVYGGSEGEGASESEAQCVPSSEGEYEEPVGDGEGDTQQDDDDEDSGSHRSSTTLELGALEPPQDSQVSSGWLGKAYNTYNAIEKDDGLGETPPWKKLRIARMVEEIMKSLAENEELAELLEVVSGDHMFC